MRVSRGTVTSEGVILHRKHDQGFMAPVKIAGMPESGKDPAPLRKDGKLVYALPGGGEWIA